MSDVVAAGMMTMGVRDPADARNDNNRLTLEHHLFFMLQVQRAVCANESALPFFWFGGGLACDTGEN